jgi:alpha-amylase
MTDIVLVFEVHQPFRVGKGFYWENRMFRNLKKGELFDAYFDRRSDGEIFRRISRKCYLPANEILLKAIDEHKREKRRFKAAFSLSGVFLEQCEAFNKDVLDSFKQLAESGCVEFLDQTYYHSLSSLYPERDEFIEQVRMHSDAMRSHLHYEPKVFENTELLYNNAIAKVVEDLGFAAIFTEGADRMLAGRSPNYVYSARDCKRLKVLLRNYKLTDDIGFRFSARWWSEWPLTADKYAKWLSTTSGDCINIFPDYETFGEHHWPETGIHEFLTHLPNEILRWENLSFSTPSEVAEKHSPVDVIDVPEIDGTVSWADVERSTSGWLGNTMQWAYYSKCRDMKPLVRESQDSDLTKVWRYLQESDHLYYMFTAGGGPGAVHTYFSPYGNPVDAFVTCLAALIDFEYRVKDLTYAANEPFRFHRSAESEGVIESWSLMGFLKSVDEVPAKSLEFHSFRGDYERWARGSLRDDTLANDFASVSASHLKGERLRRALRRIVRTSLARRDKGHLRGSDGVPVRDELCRSPKSYLHIPDEGGEDRF